MISSDKLPPPGYETQDASLRLIAILALVLVGLIALSLGVSAVIFPRRDARAAASPFVAEEAYQHWAAWQSGIARDWVELDRRTRQNLTTYGWVDRKAGVARIPIDRAMGIIAKESQP